MREYGIFGVMSYVRARDTNGCIPDARKKEARDQN